MAMKGAYRVRSAKLLALVIHLLKGTPFVYQGEEIGMTNMSFSRIEQFRDTETLGHFAELGRQGLSPEAFIAGANAQGRDNARAPMQWTNGLHGGFTTGTPWIEVNPNKREINVAADRANPDGIFAMYRALIALRRELPILVHGTVSFAALEHPQVLVYSRDLNGERLLVIANFSAKSVSFDVPSHLAKKGQPLAWTVSPRAELAAVTHLSPYEGFAVHSND